MWRDGAAMMMRLILVLMVLVFAGGTARAQERLALLIGNGNYANAVGPLENTVRDVDLIARTLLAIGFKAANIRKVTNADRVTTLLEVDQYAERLAKAGKGAIGFFYYAGHGAAHNRDRRNYLIPVDVTTLDAGFWYRSVPLEEITRKLAQNAPDAAQFVVFDACRNVLKLRNRSVGTPGFVRVAEQRGMFIAFSTSPGDFANDGNGQNGPYASALAAELSKPGLTHLDVFQNVKERVAKETVTQVPWERNGLLARVRLGPVAAPQPAAKSAAQRRNDYSYRRRSEAAQAWALIAKSKDRADFDAFRRQYGKANPFYDRLAEKRIASLAPPAPVASCRGVRAQVVGKGAVCLDPGDAASREFQDCKGGVCGPTMVALPTGSYKRGSEDGASDEKPVREVTIGYHMAVGKFEVTFAEWDACVADGGCKYKPRDAGWGRGNRPAIRVSWEDITGQYLPWLNRRLGLSGDTAYRLLSEAEWEYAARGGTSARARHTTYSWGDDIGRGNANCYGCGSQWDNKQTAPVGSFKPNAFGLHDMHGNVWEWVQDCYAGSYAKAPTNGSKAPGTKDCSRVLRGGSWHNLPQFLRSAYRYWNQPDLRSGDIGFRLARTLNPTP